MFVDESHLQYLIHYGGEGRQRKKPGVDIPSYFFETDSHTDPEAHNFSKVGWQQVPEICLALQPKSWGHRRACDPIFHRCRGVGLQSSHLYSMYSLSHLLSTTFPTLQVRLARKGLELGPGLLSSKEHDNIVSLPCKGNCCLCC